MNKCIFVQTNTGATENAIANIPTESMISSKDVIKVSFKILASQLWYHDSILSHHAYDQKATYIWIYGIYVHVWTSIGLSWTIINYVMISVIYTLKHG